MAKLTVVKTLAKAKTHTKKGEFAQAQELFLSVLRMFPNNKKAQHGLIALSGGKQSLAEQSPPQSVTDALMHLYNQGELKAVVDQAKNLTAFYPKAFDLWNILGVSSAQIGAFDQAVLAFNKIIEINPKNASAHYNLGNVLKDKGQTLDAIEAYTKALELKSDYEAAYNNLVAALQRQGRPGEQRQQNALKIYKKSILVRAEHADTLFYQGVEFQEQGKVEEAINTYKEAISLWPDYAEAYNNMGNALKEQGKLGEAIDAFNKAIVIKPDYAEAYNNMGNALKEQGMLEEAIEAYKKALLLKPDFAGAHYNMGNAFQEKDVLKEAMEAYCNALSIQPGFVEAQETFLGLRVQLQGRARNVSENFTQISEDIQLEAVQGPISHINNAISSFLSADEKQTHRHIHSFKTCTREVLDNLEPKDQQFCFSYSRYLSALLKKPLGEAPDLGNSNVLYHIGESHCLSYAHRNIEINGAKSLIVPMITFGAKAFHFSKATENRFKAITKANLAFIPEGSAVFVSFGEIDCRSNEGFIPAAAKLAHSVDDLIVDTVTGYLQWFTRHNKLWNHNIYLVNVPAPEYDQTYDAKKNADVANVVTLFNQEMEKQIAQYSFNLIDVFEFTLGKDGFSNSQYHIDGKHLGAKALPEIEKQLSNFSADGFK